MEKKMADIVVVGAGICGLQLGALLASDGRKVTVLEKSSHVGGRAFLWEKEGFTVDNGIHLIRFGPKSATARVFKHLGKPLDFVDLGQSKVSLPGGRVVDFPTSPSGFLTTKMMGRRERLKTLALMLRLKLESQEKLLDTSVEDWMQKRQIAGGMRQYLHLVSASMQVCPDLNRSSAGEMLLNIQSVLKKGRSVMYPTQGWRYIYDVLLDEIGRQGQVRTEAKVKNIVVSNGKIRGVELDNGEHIDATMVIVNLPVQQLFQVLDESLVPTNFARLCQNQIPTAGVSLDYGLKRKVSEDQGLWYLTSPMSFGLFTSNLCPDLAPPGKQLLTWFCPASQEEMADRKRVRTLEKALEQAIFRVFHGLEDAIQWKRSMHLDMVDGVEVNVDQHRDKRPGYRVPEGKDLVAVRNRL
ncbi:MAG: NAD(P)/FAD-dependent oxidoreductase, partial [Proteobacteria bacterium]|nr:NAD(P)/FAD-dependent oxidoreductase [Pseudomonadota bacterium]